VWIEPHSSLIVVSYDAEAALLDWDVSDIYQLRLPSFDRVHAALSRRKSPGTTSKCCLFIASGLRSIAADNANPANVFLSHRPQFLPIARKQRYHTPCHNCIIQPSNQEIRIPICGIGCGITHDDLGLVFNPFFSIKAEGLGLGLTTVKRIVEHHKGTISVDSTRGKGTAFTVCLPCS
jgi:light-regulated signal transduction histidine kinase (bacteriophytochrome)